MFDDNRIYVGDDDEVYESEADYLAAEGTEEVINETDQNLVNAEDEDDNSLYFKEGEEEATEEESTEEPARPETTISDVFEFQLSDKRKVTHSKQEVEDIINDIYAGKVVSKEAYEQAKSLADEAIKSQSLITESQVGKWMIEQRRLGKSDVEIMRAIADHYNSQSDYLENTPEEVREIDKLKAEIEALKSVKQQEALTTQQQQQYQEAYNHNFQLFTETFKEYGFNDYRTEVPVNQQNDIARYLKEEFYPHVPDEQFALVKVTPKQFKYAVSEVLGQPKTEPQTKNVENYNKQKSAPKVASGNITKTTPKTGAYSPREGTTPRDRAIRLQQLLRAT